MNFTAAIRKLLQLVQKLNPFDSPHRDPEAVSTDQAPHNHNLDWAKIIVVFSLASAVEIAVLSVQIHSQLPIVFYSLNMAMLLAFTCFFMSKSVHSNCPVVAQVFERFGIFFGVTAFFISITIPFADIWFKCIACFIYAISWLVILFCNTFCI